LAATAAATTACACECKSGGGKKPRVSHTDVVPDVRNGSQPANQDASRSYYSRLFLPAPRCDVNSVENTVVLVVVVTHPWLSERSRMRRVYGALRSRGGGGAKGGGGGGGGGGGRRGGGGGSKGK